MNSLRTIACQTFTALSALLMISCATTVPGREAGSVRVLKNAADLRPGQDEPGVLMYVNREADFGKYRNVMVDPVTIWSGANLRKMTSEDQEAIATYFRDALVRELGVDSSIVNRPGPQTLRVRTVITEIDDSEVLLDAMTTAAPSGFALSTARRVALGSHAFVGGVTVETEVTDSTSGQRLMAAVVSRGGGKNWKNKLDKWKDAKAAADYLAERLRLQLAAYRAGQFPPGS